MPRRFSRCRCWPIGARPNSNRISSIPPLTETLEQVEAAFREGTVFKALWDWRIVGSARTLIERRHLPRLSGHHPSEYSKPRRRNPTDARPRSPIPRRPTIRTLHQPEKPSQSALLREAGLPTVSSRPSRRPRESGLYGETGGVALLKLAQQLPGDQICRRRLRRRGNCPPAQFGDGVASCWLEFPDALTRQAWALHPPSLTAASDTERVARHQTERLKPTSA